MTPQPIRFDYALKIALYLQTFFGLRREQALEFAFTRSREGLYEYRFGGTIGGKFWDNDGRWYVAGYAPHLSRELETCITMVNVKLAALKAKYEEGRPAWITESNPEVLRTQAEAEWASLREEGAS